MAKLIKKVNVVGVDKEGIEKDDSFPTAYKFPFKLSEVPDLRWVEVFEYVHKNQIYTCEKRRAYVSGDTIVVVLDDLDDKQHQAELIRRAVDEANKKVDQINKKLQTEEGERREQREKERGTIDKLKNEGDDIKFP